MRKLFYSIALLAVLFVVACGKSGEVKPSSEGKLTKDLQLSDDQTVYGLACDGCTDSVVYLLPNDGSDPIRYDIIDAKRHNRIIGKLKIGDWIGVVLNREDTTVADMVIDLDQLKGTWCYVVMPRMRDYANMSKRQQARVMENMSDSLKETYLIPREYGFTLKRQFAAQPVGYVRQATALEDESPVVYPELPMYNAWHILNGRLILTRPENNQMMMLSMQKEKEKQVEVAMVNDTADVIFMDEDSLVLQFADHQQSYYRLSNAQDANRLAREKAEKLAREAQKKVQE